MAPLKQSSILVDVIKQHSGIVTAQRRVKAVGPGKFFPNLTASEQKVDYMFEAVEFAERHSFAKHTKAWGNAHVGPGIRCICESDAVDDPNNKGFWTTLHLFNRWRHETYKNNPEAEMQYLDELPMLLDKHTPTEEKAEPPVKAYFTLHHTGMHTYACAAAHAQ
jgi:hypothetical protein